MRDSNVVFRKALVVHLPILPVVRVALACLDLCSVGQGAARLYHGGSRCRVHGLVLQREDHSVLRTPLLLPMPHTNSEVARSYHDMTA